MITLARWRDDNPTVPESFKIFGDVHRLCTFGTGGVGRDGLVNAGESLRWRVHAPTLTTARGWRLLPLAVDGCVNLIIYLPTFIYNAATVIRSRFIHTIFPLFLNTGILYLTLLELKIVFHFFAFYEANAVNFSL